MDSHQWQKTSPLYGANSVTAKQQIMVKPDWAGVKAGRWSNGEVWDIMSEKLLCMISVFVQVKNFGRVFALHLSE